MTRRASGLGVVRSVVAAACATMLLTSCAPKPPTLEEESTRTSVRGPSLESAAGAEAVAEAEPVLAAPGAEGTLEIREVRIVEDNGQQGVFAKLSHPPRDMSYVVLDNPSRLVIELQGDTPAGIAAQRYPLENELIDQVQVGSDQGKIRLTIVLRGSSMPTYSVDRLNDTLVAFIGEPRGTTLPVREQVVFTDRAVPGAVPPPPAIVASMGDDAMADGPAPGIRVSRPVRGASSQSPVVSLVADEPPVLLPPDEVEPPTQDYGADFLSRKKSYYGQPISLDLKDADIHNVIRLLADVSNLNIVATDDVKGTVTLRLFDVPWDQALDILLQVQNLESVREGNVVRISTVKRLREEREEIAKAQEAARTIEPLEIAYLRVHYHKAKAVADLISGAARSQSSQSSSSGGRRGGQQEIYGVLTERGSVMVDEFTNTLIVRDIRRGIESARDLTRRLDIQIPQVLIESSIVEATTDFSRDLGVQWGYQANVGPQTGTSTGANFPGSVQFGGSGLNSGTNGVPFLFDFPASSVAAGGGSVLDLALGSLNGVQALNVRLSALEAKGKGRVISRPRVVTLNNVAARIQSLTVLRVRLPSTGTVINTGAGGNAGAQNTATEKIETGITLEVTPQVSGDGFVLLDMFAKSSQADFSQTVDNIPTEITREATSHVLVRDGQTVVLGGIYRDTNSANQSSVPFFDTIPGIGWLFGSTSRIKRREDLLVFITPRVLGPYKSKALPTGQELWNRRDENG